MPDTAICVCLAQKKHVSALLAISNRAAVSTAANFAVDPELLEHWEGQWEATHERFPWLVALAGDEVVGFAKAAPWAGRCAYSHTAEITVYIEPGFQGRGVGTSLYRQLLSTLTAQGFHSVLAGIALPNPASVALHEAMGLKKIAHLEQVGWKFDRWHDVGYWQAILRPRSEPATTIRPVGEVFESPGLPPQG